jgi:hypothetical protein
VVSSLAYEMLQKTLNESVEAEKEALHLTGMEGYLIIAATLSPKLVNR